MKTYLINLDRDTDRLERMQRQLGACGLEYSRFPAVHGLNLPDWLRPYFLNESGGKASELSDGEIGCYASHLSVMKMASDSNETTLILEDDLKLCDDFAQLLDTCLKLEVTWDMFRFSSMDKHPAAPLTRINANFTVVNYLRVPPNVGAYLVTPVGARKFLNWPQARWRPVDQDLRRPWENGVVTVGVFPNPVSQNHNASSIDAIGGRAKGRKKYARDSKFRDRLSRLSYNIRELGAFKTILGSAGLSKARPPRPFSPK